MEKVIAMQTLQRYAWLRALIYLVFGISIFLFPRAIFQFSVYLISFYLLISGGLNLITAFRLRRQSPFYTSDLSSGFFKIVAALFVLLFARGIVSILPLFLGMLLLVYGVFKFIQTHNHRQFVNVVPWSGFIYSILIIIAGLLLLFNPFRSVLLGFQVFGVVLILMSIGEIIDWWQIQHNR